MGLGLGLLVLNEKHADEEITSNACHSHGGVWQHLITLSSKSLEACRMFFYHSSACYARRARYYFTIIRPSACLSVRLSSAGIDSKRMDISSHVLTIYYGRHSSYKIPLHRAVCRKKSEGFTEMRSQRRRYRDAEGVEDGWGLGRGIPLQRTRGLQTPSPLMG